MADIVCHALNFRFSQTNTFSQAIRFRVLHVLDVSVCHSSAMLTIARYDAPHFPHGLDLTEDNGQTAKRTSMRFP